MFKCSKFIPYSSFRQERSVADQMRSGQVRHQMYHQTDSFHENEIKAYK